MVSKLWAIVLVLIMTLVGSGSYFLQAGSLNQKASPVVGAGFAYSTRQMVVPPGANLIQQNEEVSWIGRQGVVGQTSYLIQGTVLGIINSTVTGSSSHYFVTTHYLIRIESVFRGVIQPGANIIASQVGGVAKIDGLMYVNDSYEGFPPLRIGNESILALDKSRGVLGPDAIFYLQNGRVYSLSPDWNVSGLSVSSFLQAWNGTTQSTTSVETTSTSTRAANGP